MMKNIITAFALVLVCSFSANAQNLYGKEFSTKEVIPVEALEKKMGTKKEMPVVVSGVITEVCQVAGCWIKLQNDKGEDVFVKITDHEFSVPVEMVGKDVIVSGTAVVKTISVEEQKHYAEDAGKSSDDLVGITQPKTQLRINATGMMISE